MSASEPARPSVRVWRRADFDPKAARRDAEVSGLKETASSSTTLTPAGTVGRSGDQRHDGLGFIRRRLRSMLRKQKHRPGQGRCLNDHKQWPNSFFANLGLFTMSTAHQLARQSRCGNN